MDSYNQYKGQQKRNLSQNLIEEIIRDLALLELTRIWFSDKFRLQSIIF